VASAKDLRLSRNGALAHHGRWRELDPCSFSYAGEVLGVHNGHALLVDARRLAEHLDELRIGKLQKGQVVFGSFRGEVGLESVMLADVPRETFNVREPIAGKCSRGCTSSRPAAYSSPRGLPCAATTRVRGARTATAACWNFCAADAGLQAGSGLGPSARLRGAATEQRDLQQRPQHGRHQQRNEHRDNYESERSDPDRAAFGSDGACGPARRCRIAARDAGSSSVRPRIAASGAGCRDLARASVATVGRAEGRHASHPVTAGRRRAA
jgi:hypothetical protein